MLPVCLFNGCVVDVSDDFVSIGCDCVAEHLVSDAGRPLVPDTD